MSGSFFSARSPPSVGLDNVGNSCYINSVLQSLFLTDTFRSRILSLRLTPAEMKQFGTLRALQHTFAMLNYCSRDRYTPRAFACEMPARFNSGQQQDADEYAKYLLDMVAASVAQLVKQRQATMKRKVEDIAVEPSQREEKKCDVKRDTPTEERMEVEEQHGKIKGGAQPLTLPASTYVNGMLPSATVQRNNMLSTASPATSATVQSAVPPVSTSSSAITSQSPFTPPPPSPLDVDPYFGGLSSSCISCLRCGSVSKKDEAFLELPLPMQQMDEDQRCTLMDKIEQVRQAALMGRRIESEQQEDVVMQAEKSPKQSLTDAINSGSSVPALPLAVLAKIAAFSAPLQETSKALRSASTSLPASRPAIASKPTQPTSVASSAQSASSLPTTTVSAASAGGSRELPLDVLARIAEFAAVRPKSQSSTASASPHSALSKTDNTSARSTSSSSFSTSGSTTAMSDGCTSSMQDSSAPSLLSSSSSSISLPASSTQASSSANVLLATFLAQAILQLQAAAAVTALSTVAAAVQKVQEEQLEAEVDKAKRESLMDVDESSKKQEEECTALVVYAPPPHKPLPASDSPTVDSRADSTLSTSTALILVPSQSPASDQSSFSFTTSSPSVLQLSAMLALYLAPELLTGDNAYHCSHCHSKQPATKTLTITQPPPHLMLCLKRNSYNKSTHSRNKITTEVKFPALLALPTASATSASPSAAVYCLYSVVVHGGVSADSGHYYAIGRWSGELRRRMRAELQQLVRDSGSDRRAGAGDWLRYERELEESARSGEMWMMNDSSVSSASFTTIAQLTKRCATDVAYLLLYVRVDDDDEAGGGDSDSGEREVLTVNPLLERLATMEQQIWVKQQEKAAKEALTSVMQRLPKLPDYKPPPEDYVDPDM